MAKMPLKSINPDDLRNRLAPLTGRLPSLHHHEPSVPEGLNGFQERITALWREAQSTFMEIGRLLDEAQRRFTAEDYQILVDALPFSKGPRSQILSAYRAIQSGALPSGLEQSGYSLVYQVARMDEQQRSDAIRAGVIRPGMTRAELMAFRRAHETHPLPGNAEVLPPESRETLERELSDLLHQRARLEHRISLLQARLGATPLRPLSEDISH